MGGGLVMGNSLFTTVPFSLLNDEIVAAAGQAAGQVLAATGYD